MAYRVVGLSPAQFEPYFALDDEALERLGARRVRADADSLPCRVSLAHADIGEELLLLNHEHQSAHSPYRASHAIYVRRGIQSAAASVDTLPVVLATRLLSIRAFDQQGMMLDADVCEGSMAEQLINRLFANPGVSYLHAHTARRGCYLACIERSLTMS